MSRIRITHTTTYRYSQPVGFGLHKLVIRPREGHDIQVENISLDIRPRGHVSWHRDLFGNSIAFATFSEPSDTLEFRSEADVLKRDLASHRNLLEVLPVRFPVAYESQEKPVVEGYLMPVYPTETSLLREWMEKTFAPNPGEDAVALTQEVNAWIHDNVKYNRRDDRGVQTPAQTLEMLSGSCRDMATLMLEGLRSIGLATRFASGYLDSASAAAGRASTHAWMEIYFPDHGWFGCDPTLGESTSQKHIVTGVSSHPRGVMPISGAYSGPREAFVNLSVAVKIESAEKNSPPHTAIGDEACENSDVI